MTDKQMSLRQNTDVAINADRPQGLEQESLREDLIIPRAKLLQALSPECTDGHGKPGQIINSLTKEILPSEFIPVMKFYQWIRFNPRDSKAHGFNPDQAAGDLIWQSFNPYDDRVLKEGQFGQNGERPLATKFICFLSYFPGVDMPVVLSFSNTSLKAGRALLTQLEYSKGPIWEKKFKVVSKKVSNEKGTYYVLAVDPAGTATADESLIAGGWWKKYTPKKNDLDIHQEHENAESDDKGF